jgi:hypothetical protein
MGERMLMDTGAAGRERHESGGKASHRGHGGHRGEIGVGGGRILVDTRATG